MAKKRKPPKKHPRPRAATGSPSLAAGLRKAEDLLAHDRWPEAEKLLTDLDQRYPHNEEVLSLLMEAAALSGDLAQHQWAGERLVELHPDDGELRLLLAGSYATDNWTGLALWHYRAALAHLPPGPEADSARKAVEVLTKMLRDIAPFLGHTDDERVELAALHERMQLALNRHEYAQVRELGAQLLARQPDFAPALNNISEAHWREGHIAEAIDCARDVLADHPDNAFALASLARFLALTGRGDEARPVLRRLHDLSGPGRLYWAKLAETYSFLGDDQAVLDLWARAETEKQIPEDQLGLLHHLTAVAAARTGDEKAARKHWRQALKLNPDLEDAARNLDDLGLPVGERNGPWPYNLGHWVRRPLIEELTARTQAAEKARPQRPAREAAKEFLAEHPELAAAVPALLDRGDPAGKEFAVRLAGWAATPELLSALRTFAFGQRGSDALRYQAAMALLDDDVIAPGVYRMWRDGGWRDMTLITFEVVDEPVEVPGRAEVVVKLLESGVRAMHRDRAAEAEKHFRRALEQEPGAADLTYNLAITREMQGHRDEAAELVKQAHERDPNYLFARAWLARERAEAGDTDGAMELLRPLMLRKRYHPVALATVMAAQIDVFLADGETDGARQWLRMWEELLPGHPWIAEYEVRLAMARGHHGRRK